MELNVEKDVAKEAEKNAQRDRVLYQEFLDGNMNALDQLIKAYRNELIYFSYNYTKDYHASEDISHEVFVYVMKRKEVYDFKYTLRTYLYMIAKHRALNYVKSRKKIVFFDERIDPMYNEFVVVEEEVYKHIEDNRIKEAIKKLKKEYGMAVYLIDIKGLSYKDTGLIMNKNLPQIKQIILHARRRLKTILEDLQNND